MATPSSVATAGGWGGNSGSNPSSHQPHHHNNSSRRNHQKGATTPSSTPRAATATPTTATTMPTSAMAPAIAPTPPAMAPHVSHYENGNPAIPVASEADEFGVQIRTMGLKVHYTFDKEAKVQCLARCPQMLHIQTVAIHNALTIGVVDLRTCIHVITEASPEITHQDCDYTIYAVDHSEPDLPLVGYGLLSWTIDSLLRGNPMGQAPKMVTGRVTRNVLGVFGTGSRETLEIRLKLSEMAKPRRAVEHSPAEQASERSMPAPPPAPAPAPTQNDATLTPTGHSEWSSFLQSNPHIGQPVPPIAHPSGRELQPRPPSPNACQDLPPGPPPPVEQPSLPPSSVQQIEPPQELSRIAPTPVDLSAQPAVPPSSSRPSSRTSNRPPKRKPPTGRPRGRPRKKVTEGNTSGYEDGTEGEEPREEGPAKKRVKTTMVGKADSNPFSATHESLRVAASNSSSLRNFRPIATNAEVSTAIQSQELPRAPTPVPRGRFRGAPGQGGSRVHHESRLSQPPALPHTTSYSEPRPPMSPSLDGRSPESLAPTPNFSEGSPLEIGSSPPIPRIMPFLRSSPPPSSPVLPPMPIARPPRESNSANHERDRLVSEEQHPARIEDETSPPPQPPRDGGEKTSNSPVQVFPAQDGPSGQASVHVHSYTTPHPSSSAHVLLEESAQPRFVPDDSQPVPSFSTLKTGNDSSRHPAHEPATPPRTDAAEIGATSDHGVGAADAPPVVEHQLEEEPDTELQTTSQSRLHTQARLKLDALPQAQSASQVEKAAFPPSEKTPQVTSPPIDLSQDPVLQLALSFGMRDVSAPRSLPSQPSPPPRENSVQDTQQSAAPAEPHFPSAAPPAAPLGKPMRDPPRPRNNRQAHRSQSAGPLTFPMPAAPASEPSPLSRASVAAPEVTRPRTVPTSLRRATSSGPLVLPVAGGEPADIVPPQPSNTHRESYSPAESVVCPSSPQAPRSNKNIVKKHAIKQRLEQAIINGEMPPFCTNCGAIETPTWRKIWVQEKQGEPEDFEFSEKPGRVTAVEVIQRDSDDKPVLHRIIKKSLSPLDDRKLWQEMLLCNPCGIWLSKSKSHRPSDRWEKDLSRLGQERRRRGTGRAVARPKKPRFKEGVTRGHAVSEGYIPTDSIEPIEPSSPARLPDLASVVHVDLNLTIAAQGPSIVDNEGASKLAAIDDAIADVPGSRERIMGQNTTDLEADEALGTTRRLLFPTPRKDGMPKALIDVDINTVQIGEHQQWKGISKDKQGHAGNDPGQSLEEQDDLEDLFGGSPGLSRPSTPPPNATSGPVPPLKTPTRLTPSHRPITRSVSRSLHSVRSRKSPGHQPSQRTPTKAQGATLSVPGSNSNTRRRSPRLNQGGFEDAIFNTPISRRIAQMLTDQTHFSIDSQEVPGFDNLPILDSQDPEGIDFSNLLAAEAALSSPTKQAAIGFDYDGAANFWPNWNLESSLGSKD